MKASSVTDSDAGSAPDEQRALPLEPGNFVGREVRIATGEQVPELLAHVPRTRDLVAETTLTQVAPQVVQVLSRPGVAESLDPDFGEQYYLWDAYLPEPTFEDRALAKLRDGFGELSKEFGLNHFFKQLINRGKDNVAVGLVRVLNAHLAKTGQNDPENLSLNQRKILDVSRNYEANALKDLLAIFENSPGIGMKLLETVEEDLTSDLRGVVLPSLWPKLDRFDYILMALPEVEEKLKGGEYIIDVYRQLPSASSITPQQFDEIVRFCRSFPGVKYSDLLFNFMWHLDYRTTMEIMKDANNIGPEKLTEMIGAISVKDQNDLERLRKAVALWKASPDETLSGIECALLQSIDSGARYANVEAILKIYADREAINSSAAQKGRRPIKTLTDAICTYLAFYNRKRV